MKDRYPEYVELALIVQASGVRLDVFVYGYQFKGFSRFVDQISLWQLKGLSNTD